LKNPIVVALDTNDPTQALALAKKLSPFVGAFKIGPRISLRAEPGFVKKLAELALVFMDHKFFDIPSTTLSSVEAAHELGAKWVTVHALNGPDCLKELAQLEKKLKVSTPDFKVAVVSVLTSFSEKNLPPVWRDEPLSLSVKKLINEAYLSGLRTFVCSAHEVSELKKEFPDSFFIVPGIRPDGQGSQDQKRVATPKEALSLGASALVIGRPIVDATDPISAAKEIVGSL